MTSPKPNRHQRRKQRTQQQLEQATEELLMEKGYEATSIQDIVDRADLGRGTFYLHFNDKDEVVWALFEKALLQIALIPAPSPDLFNSLNRFFTSVAENKAFFRLLFCGQASALLTRRTQDWLTNQCAQLLAQQAPSKKGYSPAQLQWLGGGLRQLLWWWLDQAPSFSPQDAALLAYQNLQPWLAGEAL